MVTLLVTGSMADTTGAIWKPYIHEDSSDGSVHSEDEADIENEPKVIGVRMNVVSFNFELGGRDRGAVLAPVEPVARVYEPLHYNGGGMAPDRLNLTKCLIDFSGASTVKLLYGTHGPNSGTIAVNCLDVAAYAAWHPQAFLDNPNWHSVPASNFIKEVRSGTP